MKLVLTDEDRNSMLWRKIVKHLDEKIAELRVENDSPQLDTTQTAIKRGQILSLVNIKREGGEAAERTAPQEF